MVEIDREQERNEKEKLSGEQFLRAVIKSIISRDADLGLLDAMIRGSEVGEAALKQLMICAKADCERCTLVPNPEKYAECKQVMETCDTILRECLGLPEKGDDDGKTAE